MDRAKVRINAFLASAGLGSRRSVESLILAGEVVVNGRIVRDLSTRIDPKADRIACRGKMVAPREFQYVMFHKPRGCACTRSDPHAPKTIYDLLPPALRGLKYGGRLDMDSEGLLLLSNDGAWLEKVTHPRHDVKKVYEVEVRGVPGIETLQKARQGIRNEGEFLKAESANVILHRPDTTLLKVVLKEGRKREIRRIFKTLGHSVLRLKRVSIGPLQLGKLKPREWRNLAKDEIQNFLQEKHLFVK